MKLVFTGIQGCGKGTQARLLIENYGFKLIEMGGALRDIAKQDTELGRLVKETIEAGYQVSPEIVGKVIEDTLENETAEHVIYDGFIRNEGNKKSFENICNDYQVVFFELSKEKAMGRLLGRMYDPETGETFVSGTTHNPQTGAELVKRKDDNEDSIMTRINAYVEKTLPVVGIQKEEGKVIEIDADQSIEKVFEEIVKKLNLQK